MSDTAKRSFVAQATVLKTCPEGNILRRGHASRYNRRRRRTSEGTDRKPPPNSREASSVGKSVPLRAPARIMRARWSHFFGGTVLCIRGPPALIFWVMVVSRAQKYASFVTGRCLWRGNAQYPIFENRRVAVVTLEAGEPSATNSMSPPTVMVECDGRSRCRWP